MIDDIDYKILAILQEKARIPNAEVARQVGMAPSAVLERIRKLEERHIIEGYEVHLNPESFNQGLTAFIHIVPDLEAGHLLGDKLAAITGVQDVYQVAGGNDGYLLKLRVADNPELGRILAEEIGILSGVRETRTNIVLSTVKESRQIDLNRLSQD